MNEGGGPPISLVIRARSTFTASRPVWKSYPGGAGLFFNTTATQAVTVPMMIIPTTATGQSWAWGMNVATEGGNGTGAGRIYTNGVVDNTNPQVLWQGLGLGVVMISDDRSTVDASCVTSGANIVANTDCHVVITDDINVILSPGMFKAYFNGVSATLAAASNGSGVLLDPAFYSLGGLASAASRSIDGVIYYFYKYSRILSQSEALWLKSEPYAFLRSRPAVWYSFSAGQAATGNTRPPSLALTGVGI